MASSLFALGYHERVDGNDIPPFIVELRKACFARIYTADKSLAIFLGRPPRVVKKYCRFRIPNNLQDVWGISRDAANGDSTVLSEPCGGCGANHPAIADLEPINYTADTRCSALFAFLKEEVLQLLRKRHVLNDTGDQRYVVIHHHCIFDILSPNWTLIS